jgi:hypothetical protein
MLINKISHNQKVMDGLLKHNGSGVRATSSLDIFFADEADIPRIEISDSAYAQTFHAREPNDSKGRSLYQLRANRRMFHYPFDYIV